MLSFIPSKSPGGIAERPIGQLTFTSSQPFVVPEGVTSLCAVCVGPGAKAGVGNASRREGGGGGGGALAWANEIPVTPGETLDIEVGLAAQVTAIYNAVSTVVASISRAGVVLMYATSGRHGQAATSSSYGPGGFGGTFFHHASLADVGGGNGGNGGNGGTYEAANPPTTGGGGGAAGYSGRGGVGASGGGGMVSKIVVGNAALADSGGGAGSSNPGTGATTYIGGGVGLQGRGPNGTQNPKAGSGNPGSPPGPYFGAGSSSKNFGYALDGAVRIIWGPGRAFPETDTQDR